MTVLVTGGSGFVGSYVVRDLIRTGNRVVVYDAAVRSNALQSVLQDQPPDDLLITVQGTITDGWLLLRLCEEYKVERIVHLASPLTQDVTANPVRGIQDVCVGTATIFEVARACRVRRVIWTSSVAVFGKASMYPSGPLSNDAPHRPLSLYGSCKSLCETMAQRYRNADGLDSVGLRLTVVYGAGRLRGYMSYPSHLVRDVALGRPVRIPFGNQVINWQHVEDVSGMVLSALDEAPSVPTLVFNTNGDPRTYSEAASVLQQLAPTASIQVDAGLDDALRDIPMDFDDSQFSQDFRYRPRFSLEDGLRATFDEYLRMLSRGTVTPGTHERTA